MVISEISKSYKSADGSQSVILDKFSLNVNNGDFISVMGPSGSGKTTLLKILCGLEKADTVKKGDGMRKRIVLIMAIACILLITGCGASNSDEDPDGIDNQINVTYVENAGQTDTEENISTDGVADYPAAIMVNDTVYLMEGNPMPAEVDESAIIGYTESYTGTFPENNGETNFNPELGMPYAQVEGGIAVFYNNEWYLCTPFSNEITITFTGDH